MIFLVYVGKYSFNRTSGEGLFNFSNEIINHFIEPTLFLDNI